MYLIILDMDGYGSVEGLENDGSMMTKTVSITLSAAAAYMVLVIGLMAWCRYRRRKRKQAYLDANPASPLTDCEYIAYSDSYIFHSFHSFVNLNNSIHIT